MDLFFVCGLLAGMTLSAAMAVALDRALWNRRRPQDPHLPDFVGRQHKPRAVTRLRKDHFTWEI
jgi:hypothetical protein